MALWKQIILKVLLRRWWVNNWWGVWHDAETLTNEGFAAAAIISSPRNPFVETLLQPLVIVKDHGQLLMDSAQHSYIILYVIMALSLDNEHCLFLIVISFFRLEVQTVITIILSPVYHVCLMLVGLLLFLFSPFCASNHVCMHYHCNSFFTTLTPFLHR